MIIARVPLRISFAGGGSDLPSAHQTTPGACCTLAINQYVTVTLQPSFDGDVVVAYRQIERVPTADAVQHSLVRAALQRFGIARGIEIHSIADIPGGTGLGSSSAFAVALLAALYRWQRRPLLWPDLIADEACQLEMEACGGRIGLQDQFATALGGANLLTFRNRAVHADRLELAPSLASHLLLLWTGAVRSGDAGGCIARQAPPKTEELARLARHAAAAIEEHDYQRLGLIVTTGWELKRAQGGSDAATDAWIAAAREAGAWGAKRCGAGGGGFILCIAPRDRHAAIVEATGLRPVPIAPATEGVNVWEV